MTTKNKKDIVYVLKRCIEDSVAYNNFIYPKKGYVEAQDWKDTRKCGKGLHGWTDGFTSYYDYDLKGNFVVLEVDKKDGYVELDDKVKFRKGKVILNTPDAKEAHDFMLSKYPNMLLHWSVSNQGYYSTSNQGHYSTSNQGHYSTSNQGDCSTSNQGDSSTSNQGYCSTSNQGLYSTSNQGECSTSNQGGSSTSNQGHSSVSVHRFCSNATSIIKFDKNSVAVIYNDNCAPHIYSKYQDRTVYFYNCKPKKVYTATPDNIKKLDEHEIIVFGSNLKGEHVGGLAKTAKDKFGAVNGTGEGLTGKSYAFPTLDTNFQQRTLGDLKKSVDNLIKTANNNTTKIFLLTKVGTGIAGYSEDAMKELFNRRDMPANIIKPEGW